MVGPSPHLSWRELRCGSGVEYPVEWRRDRAVALAWVFESIRVACGHVPIVVTSGYRTSQHNAAVAGARHSQHIEGRALDLQPPVGLTTEEFYRLIRGLATEGSAIKGIGVYRGHVHIDVRPSARLVVWRARGMDHRT